ncbi:unnamed protein product [Brachionus calyciflorus]|uniref:Uncharacterized protein n=1 Tax=Brachionus calyciflorus TaxID=104777 RepID=A0A814PCK6_9BILA|nr:unnamed protein product [Brachionus calyciflorus]
MCNKHCEYCNILREELYLITLPCGYIVCYDHLKTLPNLVDCFMCKEHIIDLNHCLNMKKNRDKIEEVKRLVKLTNLKQKLDKINSVKNDPKYFLDECFSNLTNKIDLRREQIKLEFSKSVDKSFQNIYQQVKSLQEEYEKNLDKKLKDLEMSELEENLDSIEIDEIEKIKIQPLVNYLNQIEKINFQNSYYKINFSNNDFGQIVNIIYETRLCNELSKIKKTPENCSFFSKDISLLPTGEIVGVSNLDPRNLSIWNPESKSITEIKGEDFIMYSTVTSSGYILCLDDNCYLKVWKNGYIVKKIEIIESDIYNYYSINCEDSILVVYDSSFFIGLLNFLTGYMKQFKAHESPLLSSLLFSQKEYLTSHEDYSVNLWDIVNDECLRTIRFKSRVVCMAKLNDKEIVVGTENGEIIGLEIRSFKKTQFVKTGYHKIEFIRFVEDNLFMCSIGNQLKLWKNSNKAFRVLSKKSFPSLEDAFILRKGKVLILDQNYQANIWS